MRDRDVVLGNVYDKYGTRNPIYRALVRGYFQTIDDLLASVHADRALEVGCGEGFVASWLEGRLRPATAAALDLSPEMMRSAVARYPRVRFLTGSAYRLPFPSRSFDIVFCVELLEHLVSPAEAIAEIKRVSRRWALFAVPREPIWRGLNLARGAYWSRLGNTPGHFQHWTRSGILRLLRKELHVDLVRSPFPWTMALCSV
jgi:SAM-dependent methyltransferase